MEDKNKKRRYNIDMVNEGSSNNTSDQNDQAINIKCCKSCAAVLIADCVALSCCPCALFNLLTFAFVKVPWMLGRRLVLKVKKKKKMRKRDKDRIHQELGRHHQNGAANDLVFVLGEERLADEVEIGKVSTSERSEAERLCLEFYQLGHWGFGRLSFTGIQ